MLLKFTQILSLLLLLLLPMYIKASTTEPEKWQLYCTPDDDRCYPKSDPQQNSSYNEAEQYHFYQEAPEFLDSKRLTLKRFMASGSGIIVDIVDENTFVITPSDGVRGRLYRLVSPHQNRFTLHEKYPKSIIVTLPSTKIIHHSNDKDRRTGLNDIRQRLLNTRVNYRCYGLYHSGAASCYVHTQTNIDLGEWLLSKGMVSPFGKHPARYNKANSYALEHSNGYYNKHSVSESIYNQVRKDLHGVCWSTLDPNLDDSKYFAYYESMDDCLQSGGIRGTQP